MPTNILRKTADARKPQKRGLDVVSEPRFAVMTAGNVSLRLELLDTETARLIWQALPLHSTAETWGACIHFETPLETGRDRSARINGVLGEIYFWIADDRILVPFGPTAISRPNECRLPSPCNVWARALGEVRELQALSAVRPGEKVSLVAG